MVPNSTKFRFWARITTPSVKILFSATPESFHFNTQAEQDIFNDRFQIEEI